jgi:uncharacterized membrane protein YfcA
MWQWSIYIVIGAVSGVISGLIGIGGGTIIVPALVFFCGLNQHQAQGTTLALMVPPIGLLAAWQYYSCGYVDLKIAALICAGFFLGGLIGARIATGMSSIWLERLFGGVLITMGVKMLFFAK